MVVSTRQEASSTVKKTDRGIFSERFRRYLMSRCLKRVENWHDAEDIVATTLLNLYRSVLEGRFTDPDGPGGARMATIKLEWAIRDYELLKANGSRARRPQVWLDRGLPAVEESPVHAIELADEFRHAQSVMRSTVSDRDESLIMRRLHGETNEEIANDIGRSPTTVSYFIREATAMVKYVLWPHKKAAYAG